MKLAFVVIFTMLCVTFGNINSSHSEPIVPKDISKLQSDVKTISEKYEYIIKNFEIQNNTILYVSAVLGSLLALVIFYFGWKAQKVESEYERIRSDRDKFRDQYDKVFDELNNKLNDLKVIESEITAIKDEIVQSKDSINKTIETFVYEYTEDYISKNMDKIIDAKSDKTNDTVTDAFTQRLDDVSSHLQLLENLQHETNPQLLYKKIDILFKSQKFNEVKNIIESIIDDDNFKKNYLFHYAYSLSNTGDQNSAHDIYTKFLEFDPLNHGALNNLGVIYKSRNELDKAIGVYERALELKKDVLYLTNLASCYENVNDAIRIYKKYWDSFVADKSFISNYTKLIEKNFCIEEINELYKNYFDNDNSVSNYLNYLEACVVSRNDSVCDELIGRIHQYNLNTKENVIYKLLITVHAGLKSEFRDNELNDIDIILESSSSLAFKWNFNLLNRIISRLGNEDLKSRITSIITKIEEMKVASTAQQTN